MTATQLYIKKWAEQQGISAAELARVANVSYDSMYAIFNNESRPRLDTLERLAIVLQCTVLDLLEPCLDGMG